MMMKMETSDQQEHREDAAHHPPCGIVDSLVSMHRMGQQMKDGDAQHQTSDETDHRLHSSMSEADQ